MSFEPQLTPIRHNKMTRARLGLPNEEESNIISLSTGVASGSETQSNPSTARDKIETAVALMAFVAMSIIYALGT